MMREPQPRAGAAGVHFDSPPIPAYLTLSTHRSCPGTPGGSWGIPGRLRRVGCTGRPGPKLEAARDGIGRDVRRNGMRRRLVAVSIPGAIAVDPALTVET